MAIPVIRSITDLARDAKALVEQAQKTQAPIVITQRGREAAVLVPIELFRRLEAPRVARMPSLRLVNPADAALFKMQVEVIDESQVAEEPDAEV